MARTNTQRYFFPVPGLSLPAALLVPCLCRRSGPQHPPGTDLSCSCRYRPSGEGKEPWLRIGRTKPRPHTGLQVSWQRLLHTHIHLKLRIRVARAPDWSEVPMDFRTERMRSWGWAATSSQGPMLRPKRMGSTESCQQGTGRLQVMHLNALLQSTGLCTTLGVSPRGNVWWSQAWHGGLCALLFTQGSTDDTYSGFWAVLWEAFRKGLVPKWGRVTCQGKAATEQLSGPLGYEGVGNCPVVVHAWLVHLCVQEGWVLLLLLTSNKTFLKPCTVCKIMHCSFWLGTPQFGISIYLSLPSHISLDAHWDLVYL